MNELLSMISVADQALLRHAWGQSYPDVVVRLFWIATIVGNGWGLLALVPFLFRRASRGATVQLLGAVIASNLTVSTLKSAVGRLRPCDELGWCEALMIHSPGGWSFPSGHAAGGFVFAGFIAVVAPRYAPLAMLYAGLVAWSRCVLGVHYPLDVIVGSLVGAFYGVLFARMKPSWERWGRFGAWVRAGEAREITATTPAS